MLFLVAVRLSGGAVALAVAIAAVMLVFEWGDPSGLVEVIGLLLDSGGGFALPSLGIGYFAYKVLREGFRKPPAKPSPPSKTTPSD